MATTLCILQLGISHCLLNQKQSKNRPLLNTSSCVIRCSATLDVHYHHAANRPTSTFYKPTMWTHDFLESLANTDNLDERNKSRVQELKEEVRIMIKDRHEKGDSLALLELIDDIERLGLGYHFCDDITLALNRIASLEELDVGVEEETINVYATALRFRLLRQHGYQVSQDLFVKFKDENSGEFMPCLRKDMKGLSSLYEASLLGFEGETIMDEAKFFAMKYLKNYRSSNQKDNYTDIMPQINHSLELPLHYRMLRLEARWYIDAYRTREDANQALLELAVLDFNMVQATHQSDLRYLSRWWNGIGLANNLSFIRDRLMECFFWSVGVVFEPKYSTCRRELTKVCALVTTIDDLYDVYGSLDELELFTDSVRRWDIDVANRLSPCTKVCFLALYNTVNEMAYDILREQGENIVPVLAQLWADLCETFLIEAKWNKTMSTPTLDDYLENAWRSVSGALILNHAYFLVSKQIKEEFLGTSLRTCHDLMKWSSMIFRLCNDLATSSGEIERGEIANAILCYMRDNDVSEEVAHGHIRKLLDEAWRRLNETRITNAHEFEGPFIDMTINLARTAQCVYQYGDGHGAPDSQTKNRIVSLFIEPI